MNIIADRKASVSLELNAGQFKAEATIAEAKVHGLDDTVQKLDRSITKIPPDAAKAAAALKLLGTSADDAGRKVQGVGVAGTTSMTRLGDAVSHARAEVRRLADEFNRTGDVSVLGKLFSAQKDLKALEGLSKRVSGALQQGAADGGRESAKTFASSMQGGLSTPALGPVLIGVLVGAAVLAAPAMSAAIMGAAGLGGIGIGIAGQFQDPMVHRAFVNMANDLLTTLREDTGAFKAPLIAAAGIFGASLQDSLNSVDFGDLAKDVEPLAAGLGGLLTSIMPGLNKMFAAAGPILKALSGDLAVVGNDISVMFAEFASGGKGAQESLRILLMVLGGLLVMVGGVVLALSKATEWFVATGEAVGSFFEHISSGVPLLQRWGAGVKSIFSDLNGANDLETTSRALTALGANAALTADDFGKLAGMAGQTAETFDTVTAKLTGALFNAIMSADQATLGWHSSLLNLHDALQQNHLAIDKHTGLVDVNTRAGIANREAVLAAMTANMQIYQSQIAVGMSAADATAAYEANTAALEAMLRKAGYTKAQIDDMIGSLKNVPAKTNADIAMHGLTEALNNLGNLIAAANGLNGRTFGFTMVSKTVYVSDYQTYRQGERGNRYGGIYQHAEQGLLSAKVYSPMGPARYAFAEPATGGEAFVPRHGDYGRSTAILDEASRWYGGRFMAAGGMSGGGGSTSVNLTLTLGPGGAPADRALAQIAHYALRTGSLQLKAGNTPVTVG